MNLSPLTILVIVVIGAAVFGGIILFGLHSGTPPATPSPVTSGTISHIPDILNLPGFGTAQNQNQSGSGGTTNGQSSSGGTQGPDTVVERSTLPAPFLPAAQAPSQQPKPSGYLLPQPQPRPLSFVPAPTPPTSQATTSYNLYSLPSPQSPQARAAAIASFSVFDASTQLRDFRTQMVKEGVIKQTEFVKINNNSDMEAFLLKLVEWKAKKASSTPAQIQDARDRIIKAYGQLQSGKK